MNDRIPVYVFRDGHFAPGRDTVMTAAPLDFVVSVYGGGGLKGEAGLEAVFGGSAFFRNDETGSCYLAIWGARNASHFRSRLRQSGRTLEIVREPPVARLAWWNTGRPSGKQGFR